MPHLLLNLPPALLTHPALQHHYARLRELTDLHPTSHTTPAALAHDLPHADAVLMDAAPPLLDDLLDLAPRLKFAALLDVTQPAARVAFRRGLPLSLARHTHAPATAERALALLLHTLAHHGRLLTNRPVGLIGFGHVGRRLAELLSPFRCPLSVHDPFAPDDLLRAFAAVRLPLPDLCARNDALLLSAAGHHVPTPLLTPTHLAALRPHTVLVSVAAPALIDTPALAAHLASGDLSAALELPATDPAHPLLAPLPHAHLVPPRDPPIETVSRALSLLIDDLEAFFTNKPRTSTLHESMVNALDP